MNYQGRGQRKYLPNFMPRNDSSLDPAVSIELVDKITTHLEVGELFLMMMDTKIVLWNGSGPRLELTNEADFCNALC